MKKVLFTLIILFSFPLVLFAQEITNVAYEPITYNDSSTTGTETDTVVWTPPSGASIVLLGVAFWSDTKTNWFVETGSTKVIPNMSMDTASGIVTIGNGIPIWKGSADATLTYTTDTAGHHSIMLWGYEY